MPLVANMSIVFEVHCVRIIPICLVIGDNYFVWLNRRFVALRNQTRLVGDPELGDETRVTGALALKELPLISF